MSAAQHNIGNQSTQLPGSYPAGNQSLGGPTIGTHGGLGTGISGTGQHVLNNQTPATAAPGVGSGVGQGGLVSSIPGQHNVGADQQQGLHGSGGQHTLGHSQGAHQFGHNTQPGTQPPVSSLVDEAHGDFSNQMHPQVSHSLQTGQGGVASPVHGQTGGVGQQQFQNQQAGVGGAGITGQQNVAQPAFISRSEILHQLRNPSPRGDYYLLVDVRRNDWLGGTINGSLNVPADSIEKSAPTLYELVRRIPLAERDPDATVVVVFYCGSCSPGRGGRSAVTFQRYLDSRGERRVKACALEGGIKGWAAAGPMYTKFMDNYDENHWRGLSSGGHGGITGQQGGLTGHGGITGQQGGLAGQQQSGLVGQQGGIAGQQTGVGGIPGGQQTGVGGVPGGQQTGLGGTHAHGGLAGQQGGFVGQQQQPGLGGVGGHHVPGAVGGNQGVGGNVGPGGVQV